jgi:trehalose 6-phosphate phosphatase
VVTTTGGASLEALLGPLRAEPASAAVLSDLDGTLAPIVSDPAAVAVPNEARELLALLCRRYALVACVTGRRALDARRIVGVAEVGYAGNHGLELLEPDRDEPKLAPGVAAQADLAREFVSALDPDELAAAGLVVEDKGPIQTLHWREAGAAERAATRAEAIADEARRAGLNPRRGRMVLEIRPGLPIDKGTAVAGLLAGRGVDRALFGGDDRTDLDAFAALDELERAGALRSAVRIGVDSDEAPDGLADRCDVLVAGTEGFLEVLRFLAVAG